MDNKDQSDCSDVQADQSLCWELMGFCRFLSCSGSKLYNAKLEELDKPQKDNVMCGAYGPTQPVSEKLV